MSKQDVRKEQIALLRFEKQLVEMGKTLATSEAIARSTDAKLDTDKSSMAFEEMKSALLNLAEITEKAHDSLMNEASNKGGITLKQINKHGPWTRIKSQFSIS